VLAVAGLEGTRSFLAAREESFGILLLRKRRDKLLTSYKKGGFIILVRAYHFSFLFSALTGEFIGV
jgi:hypothetical protein